MSQGSAPLWYASATHNESRDLATGKLIDVEFRVIGFSRSEESVEEWMGEFRFLVSSEGNGSYPGGPHQVASFEELKKEFGEPSDSVRYYDWDKEHEIATCH